MDLLIGTKNHFKIEEMMWYLKGIPGTVIHQMEEINQLIQVEENGKSLLENAQKKAREISKHTNWYVFASDAGVDIPGLGNKWDILRNQRIIGEEKNDSEKVAALIQLMKDLKGEERKCEWHIALALAKSGEVFWSTEKVCGSGYILENSPDGYIPPSTWVGHVWYYPDLGKTHNQLTEEEKNRKDLQLPMKEDLQRTIRKILDSSSKK